MYSKHSLRDSKILRYRGLSLGAPVTPYFPVEGLSLERWTLFALIDKVAPFKEHAGLSGDIGIFGVGVG